MSGFFNRDKPPQGPSKYDLLMQEEERRRARPSGVYVQNPYTRPQPAATTLDAQILQNPRGKTESQEEYVKSVLGIMARDYGYDPARENAYQASMQDIQAQLQQEEADRLRQLAQQAGLSRRGY